MSAADLLPDLVLGREVLPVAEILVERPLGLAVDNGPVALVLGDGALLRFWRSAAAEGRSDVLGGGRRGERAAEEAAGGGTGGGGGDAHWERGGGAVDVGAGPLAGGCGGARGSCALGGRRGMAGAAGGSGGRGAGGAAGGGDRIIVGGGGDALAVALPHRRRRSWGEVKTESRYGSRGERRGERREKWGMQSR